MLLFAGVFDLNSSDSFDISDKFEFFVVRNSSVIL